MPPQKKKKGEDKYHVNRGHTRVSYSRLTLVMSGKQHNCSTTAGKEQG